MISLFKDTKFYILILFFILGSCVGIAINFWFYKDIKTIDSNTIINACISEVKKIDKQNKVTFDFDKSYVLNTDNPDRWTVRLNAPDLEKENIKIACQVYRKNMKVWAVLQDASSF